MDLFAEFLSGFTATQIAVAVAATLGAAFIRGLTGFGFGILLEDALNAIPFFGFKLGFWFAQQGAIYTFVALIFIYAKKMKLRR